MRRKQIDIGLTDDDLTIVAGDFVAVESTLEHQRQLTVNNKGDFKENPTICVGAAMYLDEDDGFTSLIRAITTEFTRDGMDVQSVALDAAGHIISKAEYK